MDNKLTLFDQILYGNLIPSLDNNKPDEKFVSMISQIETVYPSFQNLHEFNFHRPFNNKTQYYHKLITNGATAYCNQIFDLINADDNFRLQKYWYNDTLKKKLISRLETIGKMLKEKQYDIDFINPRKTSFEIDTEHKTETYIIHLVKVALIKMYLEIQEAFKHLTTEDLFIEDDLYTRFIKENIPDKSFLVEAKKIDIMQNDQISPRGSKTPEFKQILADFRSESKGIPSYKNLIKNPQRFAMFETELFNYGYINTEYTFTAKHGYKNELAIIYHHLIARGYFKNFNDANRTLFKPRDFVKFLDYRYKTDADKQFRLLNNKIQKRAKFIEKRPWLANLPSC